jgi:aryl-alcohol dehydrogenase-like predicted oxidoreductase
MSSYLKSIKRGAQASETSDFCNSMIANGRAPGAFRTLGRSGLTVSSVGFGGYRIRPSAEEHADALEQALSSGCNLIDTSTNYGDGASERLIGRVMATGAQLPQRSEIVLISKVGYVQGTNLTQVKQRIEDGDPYGDVVTYEDGCWHCIHPDFIHDQVEESMERLGVQKLDVLLLHNPEYFLTDLEKHSDPRPLDERRRDFYERISRAFECMEGLVKDGVIGCYGVSSNTFVLPADSPTATSLTRMISIAEKVGGKEHAFSVIQLPFNLLETGAAQVLNNGPGHGQSVLEAAREADIGVLANRPLNAIRSGQLIRLSDFYTAEGPNHIEPLLKNANALENEFAEGLATTFDSVGIPTPALFRFAGPLSNAAEGVTDAVQWDLYISQVFSPEIGRRVEYVNELLSGPLLAAWHLWLERYVDAIGELSEAYRVRSARMTQKRSTKIARLLAPHWPVEFNASLSQKAIALIAGTPGVSCVLVGMRLPEYVTDALGVMSWRLGATPEGALTALEAMK